LKCCSVIASVNPHSQLQLNIENEAQQRMSNVSPKPHQVNKHIGHSHSQINFHVTFKWFIMQFLLAIFYVYVYRSIINKYNDYYIIIIIT